MHKFYLKPKTRPSTLSGVMFYIVKSILKQIVEPHIVYLNFFYFIV